MERLQKVIAASGYASRRKAEELISAGKVFVNGKKVTELGTKVSGNDEIMINGEFLQKEDKVYFLLNKPRGVVCTTNDEFDRKNIVELIDTNKRIYPVGRLDYDTTGLIILTNDGELSNILTHPSSGVEKTYLAKLNKNMLPEDFMKLKKGIDIDGVKCRPTKVRIKSFDVKKDTCMIEITIVEGRNHIVKRVFQELGYLVDKLSRLSYGFLDLGNLQSGDYRELNIKEVKRLYEYAKHGNKKTR